MIPRFFFFLCDFSTIIDIFMNICIMNLKRDFRPSTFSISPPPIPTLRISRNNLSFYTLMAGYRRVYKYVITVILVCGSCNVSAKSGHVRILCKICSPPAASDRARLGARKKPPPVFHIIHCGTVDGRRITAGGIAYISYGADTENHSKNT